MRVTDEASARRADLEARRDELCLESREEAAGDGARSEQRVGAATNMHERVETRQLAQDGLDGIRACKLRGERGVRGAAQRRRGR